MENQPEFVLTPQMLREHGAFVRNLAKRLVWDDHTADDVMQETWLRFLKKSPEKRNSLRPWLSTVALNVVRQKKRGEERKLRREQEVARPETHVPDLAKLDKEQLLRQVMDAVLDLKPPYREAILLRFYEDLPPREIAKRLNLPVETVRSQIRRACEQMKISLDEHNQGNRQLWCAGLLAFAGLPSSAPPGSNLPWTSSAPLKFFPSAGPIFGAAALIFIGLGLVMFPLMLGSPKSAQQPLQSASATADKSPSFPAPTGQDFSQPVRSDLSGSISSMQLQLIRHDGMPAGRVQVGVFREEEILGIFGTDDEGWTSIPSVDQPVQLICVKNGKVFHRQSFEPYKKEQVLYLPQIFSVAGKVNFMDSENPGPIDLVLQGNRLIDWRKSPNYFLGEEPPEKLWSMLEVSNGASDRWNIKTETDGRFRFDALPNDWVGHIMIPKQYLLRVQRADASDLLAVAMHSKDVGKNIVFDLQESPRIEGRVILAESAKPVPDARVAVLVKGHARFDEEADDEGKYHIQDHRLLSQGVMYARSADGRYWGAKNFSDPKLAPKQTVDISLHPADHISVVLRGPSGKILRQRKMTEQEPPPSQTARVFSTNEDPIANLIVAVLAWDPFNDFVKAAQKQDRQNYSIQVFDSQGNPVRGAKIELEYRMQWEVLADGKKIFEDLRLLRASEGYFRKMITDDWGKFELRNVVPDLVNIVIEHENFETLRYDDFRLPESGGLLPFYLKEKSQ